MEDDYIIQSQNAKLISKLTNKIINNPACIHNLEIVCDLNSGEQTQFFYQLWKKNPASKSLANTICSLNNRFGFKIVGKDNINLILHQAILKYFNDVDYNNNKNHLETIKSFVKVGASPFTQLDELFRNGLQEIASQEPPVFFPKSIFHYFFNMISAGYYVDMDMKRINLEEKLYIQHSRKKVDVLKVLGRLHHKQAKAFFNEIRGTPIDKLDKTHQGVLGEMKKLACDLLKKLDERSNELIDDV